MADGGDGDHTGLFIHPINNKVGLARHGKAAHAASDGATGVRVFGQQAQRRRKLRLNETGGLWVARFEEGCNAVKVTLGRVDSRS